MDIKSILEQPGGFLPYLLRLYLGTDSETHVYAPLAITFAKQARASAMILSDGSGPTLEPPPSPLTMDAKLTESLKQLNITTTTTTMTTQPVLSEKAKGWLNTLLDHYYASVEKRLLKEHQALAKMKRYHDDYQVTRGELTDQQKERLDQATKSYDKVLEYCRSLGECLAKTMPTLKVDEEIGGDNKMATTLIAARGDADKDWSNLPFEDEETAQFYTDLPNLTNFVPESYFAPEKKKKKRAAADSAAKASSSSRKEDDDTLDAEWMEDVDDEVMRLVEEDAKLAESEEQAETTTAAQQNKQVPIISLTGNVAVDGVLQRLPDLIDRALVDQAVVEFCNAQFNCRSVARNKLMQTFMSVPRFRADLLPYYGRFIAALHPHMPEIGATVVASLHSQFRRLFRKQHRFDLENRVKNMRYIGELLKFRVCPTHVIFYCFKRLIQPEASGSVFNSHHVEVACALLEGCGRYMLKSQETAKKFSGLVC